MPDIAQKARAPRFPLNVPIYYRKSGMLNWQDGMTVNISRTGVLFHTEEKLETDLKLEMRISLPRETTLSCQGIIVRAEPASPTKEKPGFGARMTHCRLLSPEKSPEIF